MKIRQLIDRWHTVGGSPSPRTPITLELPLHDAARLAALSEMFPALRAEELIAELLHTALDEIQEAFPYINGTTQIGEDEFGNALYEDIGQTPRFLALVKEHLAKFDPS